MNTLYSIGVIDDSLSFRTYASAVLRSKNFNILFQAKDGADGIAKISQCEFLPDLITLDIEMPFMDGFETAKIIRTNWPSIKIIAMSSMDDKDSVNRILNVGADRFLVKGKKLTTELIVVIQDLLE